MSASLESGDRAVPLTGRVTLIPIDLMLETGKAVITAANDLLIVCFRWLSMAFHGFPWLSLAFLGFR
jgi:hypothetical protein